MTTIYAGLSNSEEVQVQDVIHVSHREEVPYVVGGTEFRKGCVVMYLSETGVAKPPIGVMPEFIHIESRLKSIDDYYDRLGNVDLREIDIEFAGEVNSLLSRYLKLSNINLHYGAIEDRYPNLIHLLSPNLEVQHTC